MRRLIGLVLLVTVAGATGVAAPAARSQSLYIDVNGDGRGDADDVLTPGAYSVDLYIDTTHRADGSVATCSDPEPLSISSYTFILEWEPGRGGGTLNYGAWSDNMGFNVPAGGLESGRTIWVARAAPFNRAPGRYMIGSMEVRVTGNPVLRFLASTPIDPTALTSFGTPCGGRDFDNTYKLGSDFVDARGTSTPENRPRTVWGIIKSLSR